MYGPVSAFRNVWRNSMQSLRFMMYSSETQSSLEERIEKLVWLPFGVFYIEWMRQRLADVVISNYIEKFAHAHLRMRPFLKVCKVDIGSLDLRNPISEKDGVIVLGSERIMSPAYERIMSYLSSFPMPDTVAPPEFLVVGVKRQDSENNTEVFEFELFVDFIGALSSYLD